MIRRVASYAPPSPADPFDARIPRSINSVRSDPAGAHANFVHDNSLDVRKFPDAMAAELPSEAGILYSTKRQAWIGRDHLVDEHKPSLDFIDKSLLFAGIVCPGARSESEARLIGDVNRFLNVMNAKEHGDRPEQFLAIRRAFPINIGQDRRHVVVAGSFDAASSRQHPSATPYESFNLRLEILNQFLGR